MTEPKHRRLMRNYLLDQRFQLRTTLSFVALYLLLTSLFAGLVYQQARVASRVQSTGIAEIDAALQRELAAEDRSLLATMAGGILLLTALLTAASLVKTHRIAGPIFVVRRALQSLTAGSWPPLRDLRQGDEFHGLVQDFHGLVAAQRQRQTDLADRLDELARRSAEPELAAALRELAGQWRPPA